MRRRLLSRLVKHSFLLCGAQQICIRHLPLAPEALAPGNFPPPYSLQVCRILPRGRGLGVCFTEMEGICNGSVWS